MDLGFRSYVLFFPGIFAIDCIDDNSIYSNFESQTEPQIEPVSLPTFDDEDIDEIEEIDENPIRKEPEKVSKFIQEDKDFFKPETNYVQIPRYFTDKKSWITLTNTLCCFCHSNINEIPKPIALKQLKLLVPENEKDVDLIVSLNGKFKKNPANYVNDDEYQDKAADDFMLFNCKRDKEIKAYLIYQGLFCSLSCSIAFIRNVTDKRIDNKKESIAMTLEIYKQITGTIIYDIPDKDLWTVMKQYCGGIGKSRIEYDKKYQDQEIRYQNSLDSIK
jgi:hypothetical protein